jgi:hypothetical protein
MEALIARVVALETAAAGLRTVTAGLMVSVAEAKVTVEALAARIAELESPETWPERMNAVEVELARLDGRLDAIGGAADD